MAAIAKKVLLIGWDGADWEHIDPLLEAGLMPTLERFLNEGVMGNLATLSPVLSPMLWNSIATGKYADKHGIHGFVEPDPVNGGIRPYASTSRKVKAIWNMLTQKGYRTNVVSWWASHPAEKINGVCVSNSFSATQFVRGKGWQIRPGAVHPEEFAANLARFRVLPQELTEDHVLPFLPNAPTIDQKKDRRLATFMKILSDCASVQAVTTAIMELQEWDFTAVYFDAIDHFCHGFMQYHPPQMANTKAEDFEIYRDVIKGAYRFHDMMLERMLELAGPETTVIICSDHGFQSRHLRPHFTPREPAGPAAWHRDMGIIAMRGPGLRRDERISGASVLDITPTILALLGEPVGRDMDGKALMAAWENPQPPMVIDSWEEVPGECGMHPPGYQLDSESSKDLIKHFVALGYVEDPGDDKQKAEEGAVIEAKYNLARVYLSTRRPPRAQPLLEELVWARPWETRFLFSLARCYTSMGHLRQARRLLEATFPDPEKRPGRALMMAGQIRIGLGELEEGLQEFLAAEKAGAGVPALQVEIGHVYVRLRRWEDGERAFRNALKIDQDNAMAWQGLSTVQLRLKQWETAAESALHAIGLLYHLPQAHFNLGVALTRLGDARRAIQAFEAVLAINPGMIRAHRWLAMLYRREIGQPTTADYHLARIQELIARLKRQRTEQQDRREEIFELPPIPTPADRAAQLEKERPSPRGIAGKAEEPGHTLFVVSGLPRSGTSLMMQMLQAGGMDLITDGERMPDDDNPEGYYEWEPIKQIAKRPELLDDEALSGKALKVISMLLPSLPKRHRYRIVFMTRSIGEVVASQARMIERRGTGEARSDPDRLAAELEAHREKILRLIQQTPSMEALEVDFPSLIREPKKEIARLRDFLGADNLPKAGAMEAVIRPDLYRQKGVVSDS